MGLPMAANLLKAGHEVAVWSRQPGPAEALRALGAQIAESPRAAFRGDAFLSMLSDDSAVRAIVMDGGLFADGGSATIHVNMATISVAFADELAAFHRDGDVPYVAAPVFGRAEVAAAGRLNIVAAGDRASIAKVQPLFDAMGQRTWLVGDRPSQANAVKICGNFMLASAIEAMSEAVALISAQGVPPKTFLEIMTTALFDAPAYRGYAKIIGDQLFEPAGFRLTLGLKDIRLALSAGEAAHVPLPFASVMRDVFVEAIAHGLANSDWSAISQVALQRANLARGAAASSQDSQS
jgi:3-hydroxyisobutyrate dehydrogenase-like beta-hydroxyacid dehydrogenase